MNVLADETTLSLSRQTCRILKFHFDKQHRSSFLFQRCGSNESSLTEKLKILEHISREMKQFGGSGKVSTVAAKIPRGKAWRPGDLIEI